MTGADIAFTIPPESFSDPDGGDTLTLAAELAGGQPLPHWLDFDATTETFSGQPSDGDAAIHDVTVTAGDTGQPPSRKLRRDTHYRQPERGTVGKVRPTRWTSTSMVSWCRLMCLVLINELNGPLHSDELRTLIGVPTPDVGFFDVNGDGFATAIDALQIINFLNQNGPESESVIAVQHRSTARTCNRCR